MKRKRLVWQIVPPYLLITAVALVAVSWYSSAVFKKFHLSQISLDMQASAMIISGQFKEDIQSKAFKRIDSLSKVQGIASRLRITTILVDGTVVGDSEEDPNKMDSHLGRPEVMSAISGENGRAVRYSKTLGKKMVYRAVPVHISNEVTAVVRVSRPLVSINSAFGDLRFKIVIAGTLIALWAIFVSLWISERINQPLQNLRQGAQRFAKGDFSVKLEDSMTEEIGMLAQTMNEMASELQRLESIRRDFVANVSHELKTPITSIKGFAETLADGAINDRSKAVEFIKIIQKQSERLDSIINDLLSLSRIEHRSGVLELPIVAGNVVEAITNSIQVCQNASDKKNVQIKYHCNENLEARFNGPLLEQALINLINNAIKFGPEKGEVCIQARKEANGELKIEVSDQGAGIDKRHLPRLFERFYRVDKARSRALGGTGLGLAIVKHITQIHRGRVTVRSTPGKGSVFTICLP